MEGQLVENKSMVAPAWLLSERERPDYYGKAVVRVMQGQDHAEFSEESLKIFC